MTFMLSHALNRRLEKLVVVVSPEHLAINELCGRKRVPRRA
jgi:hypothetical protein